MAFKRHTICQTARLPDTTLATALLTKKAGVTSKKIHATRRCCQPHQETIRQSSWRLLPLSRCPPTLNL